MDLKRKLARLGPPPGARRELPPVAVEPRSSSSTEIDPAPGGGLSAGTANELAPPADGLVAPPSAASHPSSMTQAVSVPAAGGGPDAATNAPTGTSESARSEAPPGPEGRIRRLIEGLRERARPPASLGAAPARPGTPRLPAEPEQGEHGLLYVRAHRYGPDARHGRELLCGALAADGEALALLSLDEGLRGVEPGRMLLLDTETTGLSGGTGTLAFLIGLAWFEGEQLQLRQLFLRGPGEEAAMLRDLAARMRQASVLVTYNGKSFDVPLLRSRFVMNRLPPPPALPHLDLLHCARRVFRHRQEGARLVELEEHVVGHRRVGDVPGAEIPERYFRYLRTGDGGPLEPVLSHNAQDLALLAALLGLLSRQLAAAGAEGDGRDLFGLAQVATRARDFARARALAAAAAARLGEGRIAAEALALAARLARRQGEIAEAGRALRSALARAEPSQRPTLHLALAKLHEHRTGDLATALVHAARTSPAEGADAHRRRVERLGRKREARVEPDGPQLQLEEAPHEADPCASQGGQLPGISSRRSG